MQHGIQLDSVQKSVETFRIKRLLLLTTLRFLLPLTTATRLPLIFSRILPRHQLLISRPYSTLVSRASSFFNSDIDQKPPQYSMKSSQKGRSDAHAHTLHSSLTVAEGFCGSSVVHPRQCGQSDELTHNPPERRSLLAPVG
jgi:hypothetical protein